MGLLLKGKRNLARVVEEAEILNTFFEVFSSKSSPQESLTQENREKVWRKTSPQYRGLG